MYCRYDFILTSETVYSQASYHKLHSVMAALLKQDGEMFVFIFIPTIFIISHIQFLKWQLMDLFSLILCHFLVNNQ